MAAAKSWPTIVEPFYVASFFVRTSAAAKLSFYTLYSFICRTNCGFRYRPSKWPVMLVALLMLNWLSYWRSMAPTKLKVIRKHSFMLGAVSTHLKVHTYMYMYLSARLDEFDGFVLNYTFVDPQLYYLCIYYCYCCGCSCCLAAFKYVNVIKLTSRITIWAEFCRHASPHYFGLLLHDLWDSVVLCVGVSQYWLSPAGNSFCFFLFFVWAGLSNNFSGVGVDVETSIVKLKNEEYQGEVASQLNNFTLRILNKCGWQYKV